MKIKIRNKMYNTDDEPIMLVFESEEEAKRVGYDVTNMAPSSRKYCMYPDKKEWTDDNFKAITAWMKEEVEKEEV